MGRQKTARLGFDTRRGGRYRLNMGSYSRWSCVVALALVASGARGDQPVPPSVACPAPDAAPVGKRTATPIDAQDFVVQAGDVMYQLVDRDRFTLTMKGGGALPQPPILLGQDPNAKDGEGHPILLKTDCAAAARWGVVAHENQIGSVAIGVCDRTRELTPKAVCDAKGGVGSMLSVVSAARERALTPGLEPGRENRDGLDVEYIPIVMANRGFAMLPTIVVTRPSARDAVVVQYVGDGSCQPSDMPFCGVDMRGFLTRIGTRVAEHYLPS